MAETAWSALSAGSTPSLPLGGRSSEMVYRGPPLPKNGISLSRTSALSLSAITGIVVSTVDIVATIGDR